MLRHFVAAAALLVAACVLAMPAGATAGFIFWDEGYEIIDPAVPGMIIFGTSVAFTRAGQPRVAYFSPAEKALVYARSDDGGVTWQHVVVDDSDYYTLGVSLALDSSDNPCILYGEYQWPSATHPGVRFARSKDGGAHWKFSTVSTASHYSVSLALDAAGNPHALFDNAMEGGEVVYAVSANGGFTWESHTVDSAGPDGYVGFPVSLALGEDGVPHAAYARANGDLSVNQLRYAFSTNGGATWKKSTIDCGPHDIESASIRLGWGGEVQVGYAVSMTDGVVQHEVGYARFKGTSVLENTAIELVTGYPEVRLAGAKGFPILLYHNSGLGGLGWVKAALPWYGTWYVQEITEEDWMRPIDFSCAVTGDENFIGLVYKDRDTGALRFQTIFVEYHPLMLKAIAGPSIPVMQTAVTAAMPAVLRNAATPLHDYLKNLDGLQEVPDWWPLKEPPPPDPPYRRY